MREITVSGKTYNIGDYVVVEGHSIGTHTRVIRIDKIIEPYFCFVCECEDGKDIFTVNSLYIAGIATKEQIENEFEFRDKEILMSTFGKITEGLISYEWPLDNFENVTEGTSHIKPFNIDLSIYHDNRDEYCITVEEDCPYHDGEIATYLGIDYVDFIKIVLQFNGKLLSNLIEYNSNDIHHSTDTWFTNRKDCEDCIQYINELMAS
ncbi:hypothetical protein [Bacillus toyonensis]|uniref:hypothetical protein n=1 Tax=Bacillus toyonensis TaxID=155322 RepID=UPI002E20C632|nr:hypothetical protein [Bacillus toyonensis]